MAKKTRRGQKQCPNCKAWVKGTRAKSCPKCAYNFTNGRPTAPTVEAAPAAAESPTKAGSAITLEQIKAVGQMVRTIGGAGLENGRDFGPVVGRDKGLASGHGGLIL